MKKDSFHLSDLYPSAGCSATVMVTRWLFYFWHCIQPNVEIPLTIGQEGLSSCVFIFITQETFPSIALPCFPSYLSGLTFIMPITKPTTGKEDEMIMTGHEQKWAMWRKVGYLKNEDSVHKKEGQGLPCGPVDKTPGSRGRGPRFDPWWPNAA